MLAMRLVLGETKGECIVLSPSAPIIHRNWTAESWWCLLGCVFPLQSQYAMQCVKLHFGEHKIHEYCPHRQSHGGPWAERAGGQLGSSSAQKQDQAEPSSFFLLCSTPYMGSSWFLVEESAGVRWAAVAGRTRTCHSIASLLLVSDMFGLESDRAQPDHAVAISAFWHLGLLAPYGWCPQWVLSCTFTTGLS